MVSWRFVVDGWPTVDRWTDAAFMPDELGGEKQVDVLLWTLLTGAETAKTCAAQILNCFVLKMYCDFKLAEF